MTTPSQTKIVTFLEDSQWDAEALERITRPKREIPSRAIFEELPPAYYSRPSRQTSRVIALLCALVLASLVLAFVIVNL